MPSSTTVSLMAIQTFIFFELMKILFTLFFGAACVGLFLNCGIIHAQAVSTYRSETDIVYSTVVGKDLKLNAFIPASATAPVPAIVEIHGGWWFGGGAATRPEGVGGWQIFKRRGLAIFSIQLSRPPHNSYRP
jgi:acetyl esterase/lipase